jgi:hypothetical protein
MTGCWPCEQLGECRAHREARETAEAQRDADVRREQQRQWYRDTGHCGVCGQPGVFCLCRKPCACADLHECGSGLAADVVDVFSEAPPVSADQGELFP